MSNNRPTSGGPRTCFRRSLLALGVAAVGLLAVQSAAAQNLAPGNVFVDPTVLGQLQSGGQPYGAPASPYGAAPYQAPPAAGGAWQPGYQPSAPYPSQANSFPVPTGPLLFPPDEAPRSAIVGQAGGGYGAPAGAPYGQGAAPYGRAFNPQQAVQPYGAGPYASVYPTPQLPPPSIARVAPPPAPVTSYSSASSPSASSQATASPGRASPGTPPRPIALAEQPSAPPTPPVSTRSNTPAPMPSRTTNSPAPASSGSDTSRIVSIPETAARVAPPPPPPSARTAQPAAAAESSTPPPPPPRSTTASSRTAPSQAEEAAVAAPPPPPPAPRAAEPAADSSSPAVADAPAVPPPPPAEPAPANAPRASEPAPAPPPAPPAIAEAPAEAPQPEAPQPEASQPEAAEPQVAAAPPEAPTQQSALPPATETPSEEQLARVAFAADSDDLDPAAEEELRSVVARLEANPDARIQLLAYASGSDSEVLKARRLSLARALSVRKFLVDAGIGSRRMDVRAQGNKAGDGPADRVDIVTARR